MHPYDAQKAARVWQRVQTGQEPTPEAPKPPVSERDRLPELILGERSAAADYQNLARQMGPGESRILRQLSSQAMSFGNCLAGICRLVTDRPSAAPPFRPEDGPPERILRKCCGHELRSLKEYESRIDDPEYGPVFRDLVRQKQLQCRMLLELIGSLKPSPPRRSNPGS